jgi:hypothetical protein
MREFRLLNQKMKAAYEDNKLSTVFSSPPDFFPFKIRLHSMQGKLL